MPKRIESLLAEPDLGATPAPLAYPTMMKDLARQALERRPRYDYRGRTAAAVEKRIREVRRIVKRCLGLPARKLAVRPTSVEERSAVQFDGFSITPLVIERGRNWFVTAHLYVPDGLEQPAPAVMHVHGHSYQGKSSESYARRCRGLARRGFVVLFVDFPGADEREPTGHALWYPVMANMPLQSIMVQDNSAALTYLRGLPFVDEDRIGVTGSSGGGNQTAFFSATDDRLAASAPTNAPCFFSEHCNSGSGAYCHCEAIPGLVGAGVEYHDLLAAFAPRPLRVFAGIRDPLFPIVGARRAVVDAAAAYEALDAAGACTIEEHFCKHMCPDAMREGTYRFFESALRQPGDVRGPGGEGPDVDMSDRRLRALPQRPATFFTIGDLYRAKLEDARPAQVSAAGMNRLLGRSRSSSRAECRVRAEGRQRDRILLQTADGALVPVVLQTGEGEVVVALADDGKEGALARVGQQCRAAAFDWRGQGETAPPEDEWHQRAAHYLAIAGETLPGGRVTDLVGVVQWLEEQGETVCGVSAHGPEASMLAVLAATAESHLPSIELHSMVRTLKDAPGLIGKARYTAWVPGLAAVTDVPQLLEGLGDRAVVRSWVEPGEEKPREGYT